MADHPRNAAAETGTGIRVILFDLDGTLLDTKRLYLECYGRAAEPYLGRRLEPEEIMRLKPRSETALLRDLVGEQALAECMERFHEAYSRLHETHFDGIYADVVELLAELRRSGVPIGLVTGKSRRAWESTPVRDTLGAFEALVFDDDVASPKPDPEGLLAALDELDAKPQETMYAGDSMGDIRAARAAGVTPAAILWSRKPAAAADFERRAHACGARILERPMDVLELLRCS